MALIIGRAGASLTEVILLKLIFKNQMIAAFLFVILSMAMGAGFLYKLHLWLISSDYEIAPSITRDRY